MNCLICDQPIDHVAMRAKDRMVTGEGPFDILECRECRLGVTLPQLSNEELGRYYSSTYYEDFMEWNEHEQGSLLMRLRERWRKWRTSLRGGRPPFGSVLSRRPGRVLDVGCGDGGLLQGFADQGWETVGLDPSATAVAAVRSRGVEAHEGTLDDAPWADGSFDAILFQHSLEHIPGPMRALEAAARLLAPGGVIAIAVPNWGCWQKRLWRGRWAHLELPRHQQHFSTFALRRATERVGLQPIEWGTDSNVISPAYSLHYVLAGRWTTGWALWTSYALGALVYPLVRLVDSRRGGDCCYLVAQRPA